MDDRGNIYRMDEAKIKALNPREREEDVKRLQEQLARGHEEELRRLVESARNEH